LSNNALECSILIRDELAIKLAELATARKNHGFDNPIRFWNGKLQSLRARALPREREEVRGEPRL
jgi:hypothetical protein